MTTTKLTDRRRRFCDLVIGGMPASRAYRAAGYRAASDGVAETNAARLIKTDHVAAYLARHRAAAAEHAVVTLAGELAALQRFANDEEVDGASRLGAHRLLLDYLTKTTPPVRTALQMPPTGEEGDFLRRSLAVFDGMLAGLISMDPCRELMAAAQAGMNIAHGATLGDDMRAERPAGAQNAAPAAPAGDGQVVRPKWLKATPGPVPA